MENIILSEVTQASKDKKDRGPFNLVLYFSM